MQPLEQSLLRFMAEQVFCSLDDIESRIRFETDASPENAAADANRLFIEWEDRGWLETAEMDPGGLVSLTDKAFEQLPWLPRPL